MRSADGIGSFEHQDLERLDRELNAFVAETRVRCALLLDRNGRSLSTAGEALGFDGTAFASLAAADFAASDQLAVLLGETEFDSLYHEGDENSMFLVNIGGQAILAALFDASTTQGLVRVKTRAAVPELARLLDELVARQPAEQGIEAGWLEEAQDEIDRLFAD